MRLYNFFAPYLYLLFIGSSISYVFDCYFFCSLSQAIIGNTLFVIITGIIFDNLILGIQLYVVVLVLFVIIKYCKTKKSFFHHCKQLLKRGIITFSILYVFVLFSNVGKRFLYWDEFAHWGMFIKDCLRTNKIYYWSDLPYSHKDYVPFVTCFEYIYCVVAARYSEANAYRSIQLLMFSMILPIFEKSFKDLINTKSIISFFKYLSILGLVIIIPTVFNTSDGFLFYHSIYCDYYSGVLLFYCFYLTFNKSNNRKMFFSLALCCLALSKMTLIVYIPFLCGLYIISNNYKKNIRIRELSIFAVPVFLWSIYNYEVSKHIFNQNNIQSYAGVDLKK